LLLASNLLLLRRFARPFLAAHIAVAIILAQVLTLFVDGGLANTGAFWLSIFPLAAFILTGRRSGWWWSGALAAIVLVLWQQQTVGAIALPYPPGTVPAMLATYLTSAFSVSIYDAMRNHGDIAFIRRLEGLIPLKTQLERETQQRRRTEQALEQATHYDPVTGLPNRMLFFDRLGQALKRVGIGEHCSVIALSPDHFVESSHPLGKLGSDALLTQIANRLRALGEPEYTVANWNESTFLILLEGLRGQGEAAQIAGRARTLLTAPFPIEGGHDLFMTASIGVALHPQDGDHAVGLAHSAMIAMEEVRKHGGDGIDFVQGGMSAEIAQRIVLESALHHAVKRGEFQLHYQPQVDGKTHHINGVEALLRWHTPEWGMVPPDHFIPISESTDLVLDIGHWVLEEATRQAKAWQTAGLPPLKMAVNLSARQFRREQHIAETVGTILDRINLPHGLLELEITEGAAMHNMEETIAILQQLNRLGVSVAIDDFGTGFSSLAYLKRFPVQALKIDKTFVQGIHRNERDAELIAGIISIAHQLGLKTVAEGVETPEQLDVLHRHDCDHIQGYLFSRPLPAENLTPLLGSHAFLPFATA